jgi:hypothetical protein
VNPESPPRLEDVINKTLEKDRRLRYQHASELGTDLQRLKRDSSLSAVPLPLSPPAGAARATEPRAWWRRGPALVAGALALPALLAAGTQLSGRILQRDGTLIVRTELMDVANGSQLWGSIEGAIHARSGHCDRLCSAASICRSRRTGRAAG